MRHARLLLVPSYPQNVTVVEGAQATLECRVHRPATTRVQWLKRDPQTPEGADDSLRPMMVRDPPPLPNTPPWPGSSAINCSCGY